MPESQQSESTVSNQEEFDEHSPKSSLSRPKSIRYTGNSIPSKTFRLLCNAVPGEEPMQPLRMPRSRARALQQLASAKQQESSEDEATEINNACDTTGGQDQPDMVVMSPPKPTMIRWQSQCQHLDSEKTSGDDELRNNAIFQRLRRQTQEQEQLEHHENAETNGQQCEQEPKAVIREEAATSASRIQELRELQKMRRNMH